jgi:hypothetical protein
LFTEEKNEEGKVHEEITPKLAITEERKMKRDFTNPRAKAIFNTKVQEENK